MTAKTAPARGKRSRRESITVTAVYEPDEERQIEALRLMLRGSQTPVEPEDVER